MKRRESWRSRQARQPCLAAALFVAYQTGFGLLLDYAWPFLPWAAARQVLGRVAQRKRNPDVVIFGSSPVRAGDRRVGRRAGGRRPVVAGDHGAQRGVPAGDPIAATSGSWRGCSTPASARVW